MATRGVEDLMALVDWRSSGLSVDWDELSAAVGVRYPDEFRELVQAFPPGEFQSHFRLLHPAAFDSVEEYRQQIAGYAAIVRDDVLDQEDVVPVYPQPGGLLPWAMVGLAPIICWLTEGDDPSQWPVVICDSSLSQWNRYALSTADFISALVTAPSAIVELGYIARAGQPPWFTPMSPYPAPPSSRPSGGYWLEGAVPQPLAEPVEAAAALRPFVEPVPVPKLDWLATLRRMGKALPYDYKQLIHELGAVTVGPAKVSAPDGSPTDFFAELDRLSARVKAERAAGDGPRGTIFPEHGGLVTWGRLDGGGYLCWLQSGAANEWPVVVLDASLRFSVVYNMSASRFLLELATRPDRVLLPPRT